jgi:hypothetical protein
MNTQSGFDRHAAAWLADGPSELSDRVLDAALREVHMTQQRRRWSTPWRFPDMPALSRATTLAAVLVVAVIALGGAVYLIGPRFGTGGSTPSPVTTPGPTTTANLLDVSTWTPFTSARYGFNARYPSSFSAVPSFTSWQIPNFTGNMFDGFRSEGIVRWLYGASMAIPAEMTQDAWLDAYRRDIVEDESPLEPEQCFASNDVWTSITIDGRAAQVRTGCQTLEAIVFVDDRVYLFGASAYDSVVPSTAELGVPDDFRALLETWLTTITLDPAVGSPSASPIASPT